MPNPRGTRHATKGRRLDELTQSKQKSTATNFPARLRTCQIQGGGTKPSPENDINRTSTFTDAKSSARHRTCQAQARYEAEWRRLDELTQKKEIRLRTSQLDTAHAKCKGGIRNQVPNSSKNMLYIVNTLTATSNMSVSYLNIKPRSAQRGPR